MKKPLFRAALVTSTLAAVLLPVAASAASLSIDDATGDTYLSKYDETTDTSTYEPAGSQVNVDLDAVVVRHTARKVVATASYADLKRTDNRLMYLLRVRTNEGVRRDITVDTLFSGWQGAVTFAKPSGAEVRCRGLEHAIDYAANTVTVAVPRACVSAPKWVQVSVGAFALTEDPNAMVAYVDNGHNDTAQEPATWSARVRKG